MAGDNEAGTSLRELVWVGSSKEDLKAFPAAAQDAIGFALYWAQRGERHASARPLRGFRGAGVLEIAEDVDGDTYRTVYTIRMQTAIYVLHAFQKKSTHGIATPRREMELIERRLTWAEQIEAQRLARRKEQG